MTNPSDPEFSSQKTETPIQGTPTMPQRKATMRLDQRQLTLISWSAVALIVVLLLGVGYNVFLDFKNTRDIIVAEDNMRALYKAMRGYSLDFDEKLPTADKWTDQVAGYLSAPPNTPGGKMSYLHGEDEKGAPLHYAYNDVVSDYKLEDRITPEEQRKTLDLSHVVLLIELPGQADNDHVHIPPRNTPAGEDALAQALAFPHNMSNRDKATAVIIYANGSTERITRKDLK